MTKKYVSLFIFSFVVLLLSTSQVLAACDISLVAPNGGEFWSGTKTISWSDNGDPNCSTEIVKGIAYSTDGGVTFTGTGYLSGSLNATAHSWSWDTTSILDSQNLIVQVALANHRSGISANNFTVDNTAPSASAGGDATILENETHTLDASASSDNLDMSLDYSWDFDNDGSYDDDTGVAPVFNPQTWTTNGLIDGTYIVSVQVVDDAGNTDTDSMTLTVNNIAPQLTLTSLTGGEQLSGDIDITWTSSDLDTLDISIEYSANSGSSWSSVTASTADDGSYTWDTSALSLDGTNYRIRISADDGTTIVSDSSSSNILIDSVAPVADANGPYVCSEGSSVTLDGSGYDTSSIGGSDLDWDLDEDGNFDDGTGTAPSFTCVDDGVYDVFVRVTDDFSQVSVDDTTVSVSNVAPVLSTPGNDSVNEGDTYYYQGTFVDVGVSDTHSLAIDWGDGSGVQNVNGVTSPLNVAHVYTDNGNYTVTVVLTDDDGGSDSDTVTVSVANVVPSLSSYGTINASVNEGGVYMLTAGFTDAGSSDTHTISIDWDDGSVIDVNNFVTSLFSKNHVYADNGSYTVSFNLTDDDGGQVSRSIPLTVDNLAPNLTLTTPATNIFAAGSVFVNWSIIEDGVFDTVTSYLEYSADNGVSWTLLNQTSLSAPVNDVLTHSWDTTSVSDGVYVLQVRAVDSDGSESKENVTVVVDNTVPVSSAVQVAPSEVRSGSQFSVGVHVLDNNFKNATAYVYDANDTLVLSQTQTIRQDNNVVVFTFTNALVPGTYYVTVLSSDFADNVEVVGGDNQETFVVIMPLDGDPVIASFMLNKSVGVTPGETIKATCVATFSHSNNSYYEINGVTDADGVLDITAQLADGSHVVTCKAIDGVNGRFVTASTSYTVGAVSNASAADMISYLATYMSTPITTVKGALDWLYSDSLNYYNKTESDAMFVSRDNWTDIDNYPSACASGFYVSALGDTLTCVQDKDTLYTAGTGITLSSNAFALDVLYTNTLYYVKSAVYNKTEVDSLISGFDAKIDAVNASLQSEIARAIAAENNLSNDLSLVNLTLDAKIDLVNSTLFALINTVNTTLDSKIDTVNASLFSLINDTNATLYAKIDSVNASLSQDILHLDGNLSSDIDSVNSSLRLLINDTNSSLFDLINDTNATLDAKIDLVNITLDNKTDVLNASLSSDLANETLSRTQNDSFLQSQIDSLESRTVDEVAGIQLVFTKGWNQFHLPSHILVGTAQINALNLSGNYSVTNVLDSINNSYTHLSYYDGSNWQVYEVNGTQTFTEFPSVANTPDYTYYIFMNSSATATIYLQ